MTHRLGRTLFTLGIALALPAAVAAGGGGWRHGDGFNVTTHGEIDSCDDIEITAHGRTVARGEERLSLPNSGGPLLVTAAANSATTVRGWSGAAFDVLVCKAAAGRSAAAADQRLADIRLRSNGRQLTTSGPDDPDRDWIAYLVIRAPRGAAMDIGIENGPLSVAAVDGRFAIRGSNGPVSLRDVSGQVTVELENGPLSVSGGAGSMRLRTQNGPIDVDLEGTEWQGEGLDARAVNGPLALELDRAFAGGVVVESSQHSPWQCGAPCRGATRTWDDGSRRVEFGSGPVRVRLSTINGPVQIKNHGERRSDR